MRFLLRQRSPSLPATRPKPREVSGGLRVARSLRANPALLERHSFDAHAHDLVRLPGYAPQLEGASWGRRDALMVRMRSRARWHLSSSHAMSNQIRPSAIETPW